MPLKIGTSTDFYELPKCSFGDVVRLHMVQKHLALVSVDPSIHNLVLVLSHAMCKSCEFRTTKSNNKELRYGHVMQTPSHYPGVLTGLGPKETKTSIVLVWRQSTILEGIVPDSANVSMELRAAVRTVVVIFLVPHGLRADKRGTLYGYTIIERRQGDIDLAQQGGKPAADPMYHWIHPRKDNRILRRENQTLETENETKAERNKKWIEVEFSISATTSQIADSQQDNDEKCIKQVLVYKVPILINSQNPWAKGYHIEYSTLQNIVLSCTR
ncbi:hypothetical protein CHS0354_014254 [Potamilus streckersoni]|uniref:Uncharacterized protein n=1 Tax=Potamilus streckersoni TaxID=2493646 RepID=A0AAE0T1N0_9BIVA|nr:hypothetical protein CHS0354_014254 [Potamilus streckersoni]